MEIQELLTKWFDIWEKGNYRDIPVTESFCHRSPYGIIEGRETYLKLVAANEDKFLGNDIEIKDAIYGADRACVRYTVSQEDFTLEVSEWLYKGDELIKEIISYYNIEGEISEDRKLAEVH